jgi:hypothetical protein
MFDLSLIHALAIVSIELTAIYFHSLEIFIIQFVEMAFCIPKFIVIKSHYFQNVRKGECFLDDFEAVVHEIDVRALVLQNHPKSIRTSARTKKIFTSLIPNSWL